MPATVQRFSDTCGKLARRVRANQARTRERSLHDHAMRDPGIAEDHAASIARAVSRGKPGCAICS